jgi:hypothetical protein
MEGQMETRYLDSITGSFLRLLLELRPDHQQSVCDFPMCLKSRVFGMFPNPARLAGKLLKTPFYEYSLGKPGSAAVELFPDCRRFARNHSD